MPPATKRAKTSSKQPAAEGPVIYNKGLELLDKVPDDIVIAQGAHCKPITEIIKSAGFKAEEVDLYGKFKAKVLLTARDRLDKNESGYYVCVAGINPTPLGEGKSTTSVGLTLSLIHI